ncbi:MAG TPA: phosphotransferase [Candidatus Bathyarchaeia archaeon]|nr:phosphotransferase [Candidatus Bathyarchaeia archaeon]
MSGARKPGAAPEEDAARIAPVAARAWPAAILRGLEALPSDASARRYVRLHLSGRGAPASAIAMLLPDDQPANVSEELTNQDGSVADQDGSIAELPFLNLHRYLTGRGVAVPALFATALERGVLLLEDVGDRSLARAALDSLEGARRADPAPDVEDLFAAAVDTLAQIAAAIRHPDPGCQAFQQRYDRRLIGLELDVVSSHGLAPSDQGPARDPAADREMKLVLDRLGDAIAAEPDVLMHRDYHAWNLHLDASGAIRVLDFQDALVGPALYDLASLFTDRDSDRFVTPELERGLVERFARALAERGGPVWSSPLELRRQYLQAVAYRTLRVIGRFRFLAIEKQKSGYLRFLPRMARQTRRALDELGDGKLARLLAARSALFA